LIRIRTAIRLYPALWLAPVLVVMCAWYAHSQVFRFDPEPYLVSLTSQPLSTLGLIGPIVAGLAAWEAARLRRGGVWHFPAARSRLVVAGWPIVLTWAVGFAAVGAAVWTILLAKGFAVPDPRPLMVAGVVVAAHTLLGFAFGLSVSVVVAAPVAIATSLLWQVMPRAAQPLWTHLLTSQQLSTCCSAASDIGSVAMIAPVLVALGIMGASTVIMFRAASRVTVGFAVLVLAVGVAAGGVVASTEPRGDAGVARDERHLVCAGSEPEVCVWPEHASRLGEVAEIGRDAMAAWASVGLSVPGRFDEAFLSRPRDDVLRFGFGLQSSRDQIVATMAYAMLPSFLECPEGYLGYEAFEPLRAWYSATAGMSAGGLESEFGGVPYSSDGLDLLTMARRIMSLPVTKQREWVVRNSWALGACDRPAALNIDQR
jgi:hypothetical protein